IGFTLRCAHSGRVSNEIAKGQERWSNVFEGRPMPWKYTEEFYREYTRTTWNESAAAYGDWMRQLEPFRSDLVGRLAAGPGERILDLGTGPGEPAMTLARRVGLSGHI